MRHRISFVGFYLAVVGFTLLARNDQPVYADSPAAEQLEFFEKQVRPLFVEHCLECHGSKKQEASLRLDNQKGFAKGADSGPIVVPGNAGASRLMKVLGYDANDVQMPPKGKLADAQIAIIRRWVEMGAPWPSDAGNTSLEAVDLARSHWAFQSPKLPMVPPTAGATARSAVDSFLLSALSSKGLTFASPTDKYTLLRRVMSDLWGIPPTHEDVVEFEADPSPDAFEKVVDRLLASPLYGQRWGRHWLDVARYADSKGYVFTAEPRYPYSYTYRDYVVDAFNCDKPFDQFVTEQLAADAIVADPAGNDARLAALGFLTVGRRYLNNENDIIDDRIDVVARGLLGLTVGCARCHDHKFDPVPTEDYYSLYGVFASSVEPDELPVIGSAKVAAEYAAFERELAEREKAVSDYKAESLVKLMDDMRSRAGDCLVVVARENAAWEKVPASFTGKNEPRRQMVERWKRFLDQNSNKDHRVFVPWRRLAKLSADEFRSNLDQLVERWKSPDGTADANQVNPLIRQAILEKTPQSLPDLARLYGEVFLQVIGLWDARRMEDAAATALPDADAEEIRAILYGQGSPAVIAPEEAERMYGRDVRDKITALNRKVENLKVTSPGAPPRAMVVKDGPINNPRVFIRGNPSRHGKQIPRQFLQVVAGPDRKPFTKGSGRLELAQAIIDRNNPLTSRVIVNRIWQHHFGTGLVPTPSDFGTRGLPPSHPELLDWLALRIVDRNWSVKTLHRLILTSGVYRQSSVDNATAKAIDPENRLLSRMPRLRIDFEEMRDSMLAVSGRLDAALGGRPFDDLMNPQTSRRTIYALVNRNDLPGVFRAFDFADVDASAPQRPNTTVPQQALFALNSPFVQRQSQTIATDCIASASDDSARLTHLYRRVFAREPTSEERELGLQFLNQAQTTPSEKLTPWDRLAQTLLLTNEFWFVD